MKRLALAALLCLATPASAEVITGRTAEAVRCAAYISMAAHGLQTRGMIDPATYDNLIASSVYILMEKTGMEDPMPAYLQALSELRSELGAYERFNRHSDYCQREFLPN